ncbi:MAG: hypothetical protein KDJ24_05970 [Gammaproteobacteria bacterium]|nr:hypothetical protein [Gammaproteobacteria bacterium]
MLMLFVLLVQMMIPIQSHSRLVQTPDGRVFEMCTLQGVVLVDADGQHVTDEKPSRSAAMAFSDLLTAAAIDVAEPQPAWRTFVAGEFPPLLLQSPTQQSVQQRSIRAPPVLA